VEIGGILINIQVWVRWGLDESGEDSRKNKREKIL
jgi:hypothetical protein